MEPAAHILIVDDHRDIRDLLARYLSKNGYRVSTAEGSAAVERASVGNLKHTWVSYGAARDWVADDSEEFLRHATQVKNIWVPYGA